MESDDDYQSFSPLQESSPQVERRRLKRLRKKTIHAPDSPLPDSDSVDDLISIPRVDFAELEALESSSTKTLDSHCDDSNESNYPLPDSIDDLLPIPRVDFAALEAQEASATRDIDSETDEGKEPSNLEPDSVDDLLPVPRVDFAKLEALEASLTQKLDIPSEESNEPLLSHNFSGHDSEMETGLGEEREGAGNTMQTADCLASGEERRETKRALQFDDIDQRKGDLGLEISEKKRSLSQGEEEEEDGKKKKKRRTKSDNGDISKAKARAPNKRTQEKERKAYLQQLHAQSQRILRETRDASFKPIPLVNKPISSILEKIRKRKLEVSKKIMTLNSNASVAENNDDLRDDVLRTEPEDASVEKEEDISAEVVEGDRALNQVAQRESSLNADNSNDASLPSSNGNFPTQMGHDEQATPIFRRPIDDTQDLFGDSQTREEEAELPLDDLNIPVEEDFASSLLASNLKFDSDPSNHSSSEEDNDKENVDPLSHGFEDDCISPRGDPVKAFVDEEAEEEDDSDNDKLFFKETEEDDGIEDSEELNDIIATEYEEKPIDNERRNELHQKWLEQQDAAGTDNLLQRLKVSSKIRETTPPSQEKDDSEDEEEYNAEGEEDTETRYPTKVTLKKAKQIITEMFLDKDDAFLSDEDEETEKKFVKNRLVRAEEQASLFNPAEEGSSSEVFGLIKKLNTAPSRKKANASSYFDSVLKGGGGKCFSKSSFLGRSSNHHLSSSHKKGSTTVRSFIFGRDDSNSRSSISTVDEAVDTIPKENQRIRTVTAKFTCSQTKFTSRYRNASTEITSGTSLFEILKRSSGQSSICNRDDPVDLTHVMATFKMPKKPIKIDGRS